MVRCPSMVTMGTRFIWVRAQLQHLQLQCRVANANGSTENISADKGIHVKAMLECSLNYRQHSKMTAFLVFLLILEMCALIFKANSYTSSSSFLWRFRTSPGDEGIEQVMNTTWVLIRTIAIITITTISAIITFTSHHHHLSPYWVIIFTITAIMKAFAITTVKNISFVHTQQTAIRTTTVLISRILEIVVVRRTKRGELVFDR